jgi:hypothetical protein
MNPDLLLTIRRQRDLQSTTKYVDTLSPTPTIPYIPPSVTKVAGTSQIRKTSSAISLVLLEIVIALGLGLLVTLLALTYALVYDTALISAVL